MVLPPIQPPPTAPSQTQAWYTGDKIWGIDKRLVLAAVIFLVLVLPVFPVDKVIYVNGQTTTTQVNQSTSYTTSFQTYTTNTQTSIRVYKGNLEYVSDQYYTYYQPYYYNNCYFDQFGNYYCSYTYWPYYQQYVNSVTIDPTDDVVSVSTTNEAGGLITVTCTHYDGTQDVYRHVVSDDLTKSATDTVSTTVTQTSTIANSIVTPVTTTSPVPCQSCIPQHVTEHVSIIQLLFGLY